MDMTRAAWRKSSYSSDSGGNCIEVASAGPVVAVRDSKSPDGPALAFTQERWQAFTNSVKSETDRA
jgi:Domain of unknown function (DUF397)